MTHESTRTARIIAAVLIAFIAFTGQSSLGQKAKPAKSGSEKEKIVAKIGSEVLTLSEFERQYIRNNGGKDAALKSTPKERQDFMQLLIKYRLKVMEAKRRGYDRDPDVKKELAEYRQSLAIPYLTERVVIDPAIKQLYDRRREDVRVAHLLIRMITDSTGKQDTLATLQQTTDLLKQINAGTPFDTLAKQHSADTRSGAAGGDLGYFTAGMTLPVFDDVIYSMKPGDIHPSPVRTPFGYHLVKLIDRRVSRGQIRVSHILVRLPVENPADTAAGFAKISLILDSLKKGASFEEMATRNSEDPVSGAAGGDLGFAERRRYVPQFEEAAFALKNKGDLSGVVRTPFGYHIIKLVDESAGRSFEESRQELKDLFQRYGYPEANQAFVAATIAKHKTMLNKDSFEKLLATLDTANTTSTPRWDSLLTKEIRALPFIQSSARAMTVEQMIDKVKSTQELQGRLFTREGLQGTADKLIETEALAIETQDLDKRYPDFGFLMHEYEEGVLLFRAEQEAVWNKVSVNDTMLMKYWEEHKNDYTFPDRVSFSEIFVTSDSLADAMLDSLKAGVNFAELAERQTQRAGYRDKKGSWGFLNLDANDLSKEAAKMKVGDYSGKIKFQYGVSIVKVDERDPARVKTFKEAASEVSSKFQELESKRLEREWIDSLKKNFKVTEYPAVLNDAFTAVAKQTK